MKRQSMLLLLVALIRVTYSEFEHLIKRETHSRERRYLNFPEGTRAVLQISMSTGIVWELTNSPLPRWNSILSYDLGFRLPNNTRLRFRENKPSKNRRTAEDYYSLHRRERRELYNTIEGLLDSYGINGRKCVLRTLCEARQHLKPGKSLLEDVLHVIFWIPDGSGDEFETDGYDEATCEIFCESLAELCPFSMLKYLLL